MTNELTVILLAAGGGTRMRSKTPKVLHTVAGRSLVGHVLVAVGSLDPRRVVVVVGHQRELVGPHVSELRPDALLAVQEDQLGTGHAVRVAVEELAAEETLRGTVLVAYGDTPLLTGETLQAFVEEHAASDCAISVLSASVPDPTGYGRVVRGGDGEVEAIVEDKEATPAQREITEINSGILALDADFLLQALPQVRNDNAKGEYYLTDLVGLARQTGLHAGAHPVSDVTQTEGANDRVQLAEIGRELNARLLRRWMREGVTVVDPATTWVDAGVRLAADVTLLPGTQLHGGTTVGEDAVVGPDSTLTDATVGAGARVVRSHVQAAVVGEGAVVGPFSYLRPGTVLGREAKVGAFVETKNVTLGDGAKVPHLSYVGDAEIGEGANVGAGSITANYDGVAKHRTRIGRHAKTGSHNVFVAPVSVGDGASTGAGTVVRGDVPPGALGLSAGPQRTVEGWVARRRAGTPQEEAARVAGPEGAPTDEGASD